MEGRQPREKKNLRLAGDTAEVATQRGCVYTVMVVVTRVICHVLREGLGGGRNFARTRSVRGFARDVPSSLRMPRVIFIFSLFYFHVRKGTRVKRR